MKNWNSYSALRNATQRLVKFSRRVPQYVKHIFRRVDGGDFRLAVDVYATLDEVVIQASVPGLSSGDLEVSYTDHKLIIEGKTKPQPRNVQYFLQELLRGHFVRTVSLEDFPVEEERAEAWVDDGVLLIVFPKKQGAAH